MEKSKEFTVKVKDDATFIESLAMVDKYINNHPKESIFPIYDQYIHNYLQLLIDLTHEKIYEDVAVTAYGPNEEGQFLKFNPVGDNIYFNLFPNSEIYLQPDAGC